MRTERAVVKAPERRFQRLPIRLRVRCSGDGLFFSDLTRDVSPGGIGLETIDPLPEGMTLRVQLDLDGQSSFQVPGRVVWSHRVDGHRARAGLQFENISPELQTQLRQRLGREQQN